MNISNSNRLSFRLMDRNDADLLFALDQDPEVMKYINGGTPNSRQTIDDVFVPRMESYRNPDKGWGLWQVSSTEENDYLGWILIRPMEFFSDNPELDNLEIGWRFFQKSWGKGYATEAAKHILEAISQQDETIKAFSAIADTDNLGSIAIMKKLDMAFVKSYHYKDAVLDCDVDLYKIELDRA